MMGQVDVKTYGLKASVNIWKKVDVVPVEYGILEKGTHLTSWFIQLFLG